jgi:hydrogenase-1 operon protein HyaF
MHQLSQIPIRIEHRHLEAEPEEPCIASTALALLHEIIAALELLNLDGTESSIELHKAPLSAADRRALRDTLGTGEVRGTVTCLGESSVEETAISCVWWVAHRGTDGHVRAESIEICVTPSILSGDPESLPDAIENLRSRIAETANCGNPQSSSPTMRNMS